MNEEANSDPKNGNLIRLRLDNLEERQTRIEETLMEVRDAVNKLANVKLIERVDRIETRVNKLWLAVVLMAGAAFVGGSASKAAPAFFEMLTR